MEKKLSLSTTEMLALQQLVDMESDLKTARTEFLRDLTDSHGTNEILGIKVNQVSDGIVIAVLKDDESPVLPYGLSDSNVDGNEIQP